MTPARRLSNHEVVTLAVLLAGGDVQFVDTEDVAVKANEIAPGRFTWRKYPDQINIENVRTFLSDAKKPKNGSHLVGSGREGWRLTEEGLEFAREHLDQFARFRGSPSSRRRLTLQDSRERERMLGSEAFACFQRGGGEAVTRRQAETVFRIDDYVVGEARRRKVQRALTLFGADPRLGPMIRELASKVTTN